MSDYNTNQPINYFEQPSEFFNNPTTNKKESNTMNNTIQLTPRISHLRVALQESLDAIDTLRYIRQGAIDVPAYIKKAVDMAEDKTKLDQDTERFLLEDLETVDHFRPCVGKKQEKTKVEFNVELYVFPGPAVPFKSENMFMTVKFANFMDLVYQEGEPLVRVVFGPANNDNGSWQNAGLPRRYCKLKGLTDPDAHYFAPEYIPVRFLQGLDRGDKFILTETDDLRVVATIGQKQGVPFNTDFKKLLEDSLADMKS